MIYWQVRKLLGYIKPALRSIPTTSVTGLIPFGHSYSEDRRDVEVFVFDFYSLPHLRTSTRQLSPAVGRYSSVRHQGLVPERLSAVAWFTVTRCPIQSLFKIAERKSLNVRRYRRALHDADKDFMMQCSKGFS